MPSTISGPADENLDFFPRTKFVDTDTIGYENVKGETNVKLLHISAPWSSMLAEKITTFSKNPSKLPKITNEANASFYKFRHAVLYSTVDNLKNALATSPTSFKPVDVTPPKLCFMLTCQGTQYAQMGKEVYEWSPIFRQYFDECDTLINEDYGISVKDLMNSENATWVSNPLETLPYLLSLEYALLKLWESWGIKPDIVLGLSFGDYGAAVASGIITLREGIKLIMTRTQLVTDQIEAQAIGVVELDLKEFSKIMEELKNKAGMEDAWLDIACINSPLQTSVVGLREYVHKFVEICKQKGVRGHIVDPYYPYHSRLTAPVIPQFEEVTSRVQYKKSTNGQFISTVRKGRALETLDKDYYLEHLQSTALFADAVTTALESEGVTHFLEVGPQPINIQMVKDILKNNFPERGTNFEFYSSLLRNESNKVTLLNTLGRLYTAGFNINWDNVNRLMD